MYEVWGRASHPLRDRLLAKLAEAGATRGPEHLLFTGENCKRIAWSSSGLDLGTPRSTADELRGALASVLRDAQVKECAEVMRQEARHLDTFALIEKTVCSLVG